MDVRAVEGECGYCSEQVKKGSVWLPLLCSSCCRLFHLHCLRGRRPAALRGDQLFVFTCALCSPLGQESCTRPYLQWVHVLHLVLYNLMVTREGKSGYFRWNEDICGFIQSNWQSLMPGRKKTQSWHSTVAGTLSVHCPSLFQSGAKQLGENGWWSLASLSPPSPSVVMRTSRSELKVQRSDIGGAQDKKRIKLSEPSLSMEERDDMSSSPSPSPSPPPSPSSHLPSSPPSFTPLTTRQEDTLLTHLNRLGTAVNSDPKSSRLRRKLRVRQQQRNHGYATLDLDRFINHCVSATEKYIIDESRPYSEQIIPVLCRSPPPSPPPPGPSLLPYHSLLHQVSHTPVLVHGPSPPAPCLHLQLSGRANNNPQIISSPYTARLLKPYIFRTTELHPPHARLMEAIVARQTKVSPGTGASSYRPLPVDLCYLQQHHIAAVNALLSLFFWRVDISDCLQYPDCTVVALYGRLVVGCGFMTPDVKVGEAYISFLVVHPHFTRCGLGKMMLYHLIQSCRGRDVTLHVSVDNPAMLLYQSFGFKAEQFCLDFYRCYYPPSHPHSCNAYFMRLWR